MQVGHAARNFSVRCDGEEVTLATFHGKWLVLFFVSPDCSSDIALFSERFDEFQHCDADILAACTSNDPDVWAHIEGQREALGGLRYRLASDTSMALARAYGLIDESTQTALPGLFVIDPSGRLKFMTAADESVGYNVDEVLRVLQTLQGGRFFLAYWTPQSG